MKFTKPLLKATIKKRYKRFLSDIILNDQEVCAHVPNTGSMKTCWGENWTVYLSESDNPKRKLKYTLELTDNGESLISVNTSMTNKIAKEALEQKKIPELLPYTEIKPEAKIGESRLDFLLTNEEGNQTYVEVKNVTLKGENGTALFPDSVSTRGQKHLKELISLKQAGKNAAMLYIVNREDVTKFSPAVEIDPKYAELLKEAQKEGVQILAYQCKLTPSEIYLNTPIDIVL